jgi:HlyD family secretion protein
MRGPGAGAGGAGRGEAATDRRTLWLQRAGRPESVPVRTGISDGTTTEIVEGDVHEGDVLIVDASTSGEASSSAKAGAPPGGGMRRIF